MLSLENRLNDNFAATSAKSYDSFSSFHCHQSIAATAPPNKLMNHLLWWRKSLSRASKLTKSAASDYNNACVIMKCEHNRILSQSQTENNCLTKYIQTHINTSITPVVSFVNKDEGFISMHIMDRVLVNENELYSMSLCQHSPKPSDIIVNSPKSSNTTNSSHSPMPPIRNDSLFYKEVESQLWFYGSIHRDKAIEILENSTKPIGSFIVRYSTTKHSCYALSIKVPRDYQQTAIAHYLIVITPRNTFKIKGFTKEFSSLNSLIIHHSIMKEMLPCSLTLPILRDDNQFANCSKHSTLLNVYNGDDVLVDIDSDPNYQRILSRFRKTMSNCS